MAAASQANAYALSAYPKLQAIYNKYNNTVNLLRTHAILQGVKCSTLLEDGFWDEDHQNMYDYCGDLGLGAIFLHRNGGLLNNMDIDCDGSSNGTLACEDDETGQNQTSFGWLVAQYTNNKVKELDAQIHPYVVFGNVPDEKGSSPTFNPTDYGMVPLGVMAVVCNGQVHYGVWGDENAGTKTGEASLAMAKLCFPKDNLSGNVGHSANDVLYIGFRSEASAPKGANWAAKDAATFEGSIKKIGDSLVAGLK
ncbi:hypothetical protein PRZ48_001999 [Zasmidium cellare]|uniref:Endo-chitosanase n=1 Tax=Zasmidium cellare TaxID=395010 RepID=A0ABR0F2T7_ZASCE|nr:hypothetical protein PRZ48_001999 [Zasmidium cellare]